jgi:hypothetical protein
MNANMSDAEILFRAETFMESMDDIVASMFEDLGESPEALRGAQVVTSSACLLVASLINVASDAHAEAEMAAVATVIGHLVKNLDQRLKEVLPREPA